MPSKKRRASARTTTSPNLLVTSLGERTGFDPVQVAIVMVALTVPIAVSIAFFDFGSMIQTLEVEIDGTLAAPGEQP